MPRIGGGGGGFKLLHQAEAMCFLRHVFCSPGLVHRGMVDQGAAVSVYHVPVYHISYRIHMYTYLCVYINISICI